MNRSNPEPRRAAGAKPVVLAVLLQVALSCFATVAIGEQRWETVIQEDNLLVQRRPWPGSALQEIRGETRITSSLNAAMALLKDADFNQHWVYRSGGATILQQSGYAQAYVYGIVDAPWPMSDRDTVVRFDYSQDPGTRVITIDISNFPDFAPARAGFVRVPRFGGFWELRPEPNGVVKVTYQVYGDPGGWIPEWAANRAAELSVTQTLRNMPEAVAHYASTQSNQVVEPGNP